MKVGDRISNNIIIVKSKKLFVVLLCVFLISGCSSKTENVSTADISEASTVAFEEETIDVKSNEQENDMYVEYTDFSNEIDDYVVKKLNEAGNSGTEAALRENEDIFCEAWKDEYTSVVNHFLKKCKYSADKKNLKKMKSSLEEYVKAMRGAVELEIIDGYNYPTTVKNDSTKEPRSTLMGNGTRSRLNLVEGEIYRDACISLLKNKNEEDSYEIKFDEKKYNKIKKKVNNY